MSADGRKVQDLIRRREKALLTILEKARERLEISKPEWARSYLRVPEADYEKILGGKKPLLADALAHLSDKLWINLSDLDGGTLDLDAVVRNFKGMSNVLDSRYTVAARSRRHTVLNSLNFVERLRGPHLRNLVNRHFQIRDDYWTADLMKPINIRFVSDLMAYLGSQGIRDHDFRAMGMNSFATLRNTPFARRFDGVRSQPELFERYIGELIRGIEENCDYRIVRLERGQVVIESVSNPDIADALGVRQVGGAQVCTYRAGVFMSTPAYIGARPATAYETHCVHRGDSRCRFVVDFSLHRLRDTGVRLTPVI